MIVKMPLAHSVDINCIQFCPVVSESAQSSIKLATCGDDNLLKIWELRRKGDGEDKEMVDESN